MTDGDGGSIAKLMEGLPTATSVNVVNREGACGFVVSWSEPGFGFGQFEFVLDKETGEFCGNRECMDPDHVGRILARLVGKVVGEGLSP
jgi:hypothetical protein